MYFRTLKGWLLGWLLDWLWPASLPDVPWQERELRSPEPAPEPLPEVLAEPPPEVEEEPPPAFDEYNEADFIVLNSTYGRVLTLAEILRRCGPEGMFFGGFSPGQPIYNKSLGTVLYPDARLRIQIRSVEDLREAQRCGLELLSRSADGAFDGHGGMFEPWYE